MLVSSTGGLSHEKKGYSVKYFLYQRFILSWVILKNDGFRERDLHIGKEGRIGIFLSVSDPEPDMVVTVYDSVQ